MSTPHIAIITRRGLWRPDKGQRTETCPLCGAARAADQPMESIGVIVWGLACTWNSGTLVFSCVVTVQPGTDQALMASRLSAFVETIPPISGEHLASFGETGSRDNIVSETGRDALRSILKGQ